MTLENSQHIILYIMQLDLWIMAHVYEIYLTLRYPNVAYIYDDYESCNSKCPMESVETYIYC